MIAPQTFLRDVPYDPELYFGGEEITLSVRAFTHGYDLFEPSRVLLWHEYSRSYRRKHWDDHVGDDGTAWFERDAASGRRVRRLVDQPDFGRFGLGTVRTLEDYEAYAGISFRHCKVQDYTLQNGEPPNPPTDKDWPQRVRQRRVHIAVDVAQFPDGAVDDTALFDVGVFDGEGRELYSDEADAPDLADLLARGEPMAVTAQFGSQASPAKWTLTPITGTGAWLSPLSGSVDDDVVVDLHARRPTRVPGITWDAVGDRYVANLPGDIPRRHELNGSGALLVELADGHHSIREIATYLRHEHDLADDPVGELVDFYEGAHAAGLVSLREPEKGL